MPIDRENQVAAIRAKPIQDWTMDEMTLVLMYDKGLLGPVPQGAIGPDRSDRQNAALMEKQRLG